MEGKETREERDSGEIEFFVSLMLFLLPFLPFSLPIPLSLSLTLFLCKSSGQESCPSFSLFLILTFSLLHCVSDRHVDTHTAQASERPNTRTPTHTHSNRPTSYHQESNPTQKKTHTHTDLSYKNTNTHTPVVRRKEGALARQATGEACWESVTQGMHVT